MRTAQYSFVLLAQILMLCAVLSFGTKVIDLSLDPTGTTNTSEPGQPTTENQGLEGLREHLSR